MCKAILNCGEKCRYQPNSEYGDYCGVHKSHYFREKADRKREECGILNDQVRDLQSRLKVVMEKSKDIETKKLFDAFIKAQEEFNRSNKELINFIVKENEATRELIREESENTQNVVHERSFQIMMGVSQMFGVLNNKIDGIGNQLEYRPPMALVTAPPDYYKFLEDMKNCEKEQIDSEEKILCSITHWQRYEELNLKYNSTNNVDREGVYTIINQICDCMSESLRKHQLFDLVIVVENYRSSTIGQRVVKSITYNNNNNNNTGFTITRKRRPENNINEVD